MIVLTDHRRHAYRSDLIERARLILLGGGGLSALRPPLYELLSTLRNRPACVSAVWHPLGCFYLELHRDALTSLRLHVWGSKAARFSTSGLNVHAHDFDLRSCVLTGMIENRVYTQVPGAPTHRVYEIEYRGTANTLRASDRLIAVGVRSCEVMGAGDVYDVNAEHFHSIRLPVPRPTATLVAGRRRAGALGAVLGPIVGPPTYATARNPCTRREVSAALGSVLDEPWC
jgi:hypothetical protein